MLNFYILFWINNEHFPLSLQEQWSPPGRKMYFMHRYKTLPPFVWKTEKYSTSQKTITLETHSPEKNKTALTQFTWQNINHMC